MPRLYISALEFADTLEALTFPAQMTRIQALTGALDKLLARASKRVDAYCNKCIGAPPLTAVATGISAGATSVSVASTLGFDDEQEQAIQFTTTGEIVPLVPGGVQVTSWVAPYPGVLTFANPCNLSHATSEPVQGLYREVSTVGSSGSSDAYSESLLALNQAAQLARAHAPQFDTSGLTRVIFLKHYPIIQLYAIEHMLPIDTSYEALDASQVGIHPSAGYVRLPIGSFVLPEGLFRSTYTAGYQVVPDAAQQATALYAADLLQNMVSMGAVQMSQGKLRGVYGTQKDFKSRYVSAAEDVLNNANLVRKT